MQRIIKKTGIGPFLLAVLMLLPQTPVYSGVTGTLKGRVIDKKTEEPLVGVNIIIGGTTLGAASDVDGNFAVYHVPAGVYTVTATMIGYRSHVVKNVRIIMDLKTVLDIELEATMLEFHEAVTVTAKRPLLQRDVTATSHSVAGAKIDELPVDSFRDILMLQPGITADGHIRGGRDTEVLYLVDGLPIQQAMTGGTGSDLPNGSIIEMTVQTGGFNAEYGNAMSGVVNVVTKSGDDRHRFWLKGIDDRIGFEESNKTSEFELFSSGPVRRNALYYFLSANYRASDTRWWQDMTPAFGSPIEEKINLIGKLNFSVTSNIKLIGQVIYSERDWREYEYRWRYNLIGLPPRRQESTRISASLTHTLSPRLFYTLSFSHYDVYHKLREGSKEQIDPSQVYVYEVPWYYFIIDGERLWWQEAREKSNTFKADFTAQAGDINQLKAGFELQQFDLHNDLVKYEPQKSYWGLPLLNEPLYNFSSFYTYQPYQGAIYLQDKIDNEILVINIGLRYEFLNPRAQRPVVEWIPVSNFDYEQEVTDWVSAELKQQISPRLGISFPISGDDFLFVNYGQFFQIPLFDYMFTGLNYNIKKGVKALYGNPDLEPERTTALEISYKRTFKGVWLASFTYFKKEISGLIDSKTFLASDSKYEDDGFSQYVNLPTARSSGFELLLEKQYSNYFSGKIAYTLMHAQGYSNYADQGLNYQMWGFATQKVEHYLSWDQRHTLVVEAFAGVPGKYGIDVIWRWNSPRPYTYYPSRDGYLPDLDTRIEPNNARMKNVTYLDAKIYKEWRFLKKARLTTYLDVRNIFDRYNVLWIASDGKIGGELGDPGAWDVGRRVNVGLKIAFGEG